MHPPVDYPVSDDSSSCAVVGQMTYAALLEKHDAQEFITPDMIHSASVSLEAARHMPSDAKARRQPSLHEGHPILKRLLKFRG